MLTATTKLLIYAKQAEAGGFQQIQVLKFFQGPAHTLDNWTRCMTLTEDENWKTHNLLRLHPTLLHILSASNLPSCVTNLLSSLSPAQIDCKDDRKQTPLHKTMQNSHFEVIKVFLERGASFEIEDVNRDTPLVAAIRKGEETVEQIIVQMSTSPSLRGSLISRLFHDSLEHGSPSLVQRLLDVGADANAEYAREQSPLIRVVKRESDDVAEIVCLLLKKGADVAKRDRYGRTALHYAASRSNEDVVQHLLRAKADVNAEDSHGDTILAFARTTEATDTMIELLQTHGAQVTK